MWKVNGREKRRKRQSDRGRDKVSNQTRAFERSKRAKQASSQEKREKQKKQEGPRQIRIQKQDHGRRGKPSVGELLSYHACRTRVLGNHNFGVFNFANRQERGEMGGPREKGGGLDAYCMQRFAHTTSRRVFYHSFLQRLQRIWQVTLWPCFRVARMLKIEKNARKNRGDKRACH